MAKNSMRSVRLMVLAATLWGLVLAAPVSSAPLVTNGDMSLHSGTMDTSGSMCDSWTTYTRGGASITTWATGNAGTPSGPANVALGCTYAASGNGVGARQAIPVSNTTKYRITGWFRTSATDSTGTATVKCDTNGGTDYASAEQTVGQIVGGYVSATTFYPFSREVTSTGTSMTIFLDTAATTGTKYGYFDDIHMASAELLTNQSFETTGNPPTGWTKYGTSMACMNQNSSLPPFLTGNYPYVGNVVSQSGGLRQAVTGLAAGKIYRLTGWYKPVHSGCTATVKVDTDGGTDYAAAEVTVGSYTGSTTWKAFSKDIMATGTSMMVFLNATIDDFSGHYVAFDDISLVDVSDMFHYCPLNKDMDTFPGTIAATWCLYRANTNVTYAKSTSGAPSNSGNCQQVSCTAGTANDGGILQRIAVRQGGKYRVKAYVKSSGGNMYAGLKVDADGGVDPAGADWSGDNAASTTWSQLSSSVVTATGSWLTVFLHADMNNTSATRYGYFDSVALYPDAPSSASANPSTVSSGGSSAFSVAGPSGTRVAWYSDAACTTLVGTGDPFTLTNITSTTTLYVRNEIECTPGSGTLYSASTTPSTVYTTVTVQGSCTAPTITTHPQNTTVCSPDAASFSVAYTGGDPSPTLKWQSSPDGSANWADISGANSSPLSVPSTDTTNYVTGRYFRAVLTSGTCTATSNSAMLTVTPSPVIPPAPTLSDPTGYAVNVDVNAGTNPAGATFAIYVTPAVGGTGNNWVQSDGTAGSTEAWQTEAQWGVKQVVNLSPSTSYTFSVKAKTCGAATNLGSSASASTTGATNCLSNADLETFSTGVATSWTQVGASAAYASSDNHYSGLKSQRITWTSGGSNIWSYMYQRFDAQANVTYSVSAYFQMNNASRVAGQIGWDVTGGTSAAGVAWYNKQVTSWGLKGPYTVSRSTSGPITVFVGGGGSTLSANDYVEIDLVTPGCCVTDTPTAGSNSPVCQGNTLNLTASTISGATYSWTGPNGFTSDQQNPSITGATNAAAGTYSVTATVSGCATSEAGTTSVVIGTPLSTPSASSNSPLCQGSTLNLSTPEVNGAMYSWTGPNSFSSTSRTPSITNVQSVSAGTYYVTVSKDGCVSSAGSTAVAVNPLPVAPSEASNNGPICAGSSAMLSYVGGSGTTLKWYRNSGCTDLAGSGQSLSVSPSSTQQYWARWETASCGNSTTATTTVTVNPLPVAPTSAGNNGPICAGSSATLTYSGGSGTTLKWYSDSSCTNLVGTGQNASVSPSSTQQYWARWETASCGNSTTATTTVTVNPLADPPTAANVDRNNVTEDDAGQIVLTASGGSGDTLEWYTGSCGGTPVGTGAPSLSIDSPTVDTTYYARWENDCGESTCQSVTVTIAPKAVEWYSVKTQGAAGTFAVAMDPDQDNVEHPELNDPPLIEPRRGDLLIRVVFDRAIEAVDGTFSANEVAVTSLFYNYSNPASPIPGTEPVYSVTQSTTTVTDDTLEIVLRNPYSGTPPLYPLDQKKLTIELVENTISRSGTAQAVLLGDRTCQIRCLVGDVNGDIGYVGTSDLSTVRDAIRPALEGGFDGEVLLTNVATEALPDSWLCDVNISGQINVVDMALVRSRVGKRVP